MENFSEILKDFIIDKELSIRKIAKESGVSASQYGKYLDKAYPTIPVAVKIANYFDCSLDFLFGISEKRNHEKYICKEYNMGVFLQRYSELLKHNKVSHWKFCKENGLSESNIRHWRSGHSPKIENLVFIAYNLSGSLDYLLGRI